METLSKQDKTFVKELIETGNKTQSAKKAYKYKDSNTAGVMANKKLRKVKIQDAIKSIADRLPDELLERVHLEGLQATDFKLNRDGDVEYNKPDYAVRHKYLDSAYKIKGTYAPEKTVNLNLEVESTDEIKRLAEELNNLHK